MTIWFDMDGTIADLYGVENWLSDLINENTHPYEMAKPLIKMQVLARLLNRVQRMGYQIGIISWTSKGGSAEYNAAVAVAKRAWLNQHLHSVAWDQIKIVPYGMDKFTACGEGILFDDEEHNRNTWQGMAYTPDAILETLRAL